ncbi:polysaccharide lyase 6 family protein [Thalassoglobus sp.]|uniref:polysaccharide lyase 6 family protein n=1 Tax=Thalassoglobus sp. TaxID=2795869 RepID=UPI003AA8CEF1
MRDFWLVFTLVVTAHPAVAAERLLQPTDDVNKILGEAAPGDHFKLKNGVWKNFEIRFSAVGTSDRPILVEAETPGEVVFTGESKFEFGGEHIVVSGFHFKDVTTPVHILATRRSSKELANHCRVTECAFTNTLPSSGKKEQKYLSLYGTHNRVDHCHFSGKESDGTTLVVWVTDRPNHNRIDHNYLGHRKPLGRNGGETIRIGTSDVSMNESLTIVEKNLFEECNGEAEMISNKSCGNIYRENTFRRCSGTLTLRHGNRCRVEENFFLGEGARGTGGVRVIGEDHIVVNNYFSNLKGDDERSALCMMNGLKDSPLHGYFQVKNPIVAFNTFIDCKVTFSIGVGGSKKQGEPPVNSLITNNILVGKKDLVVIHPFGEPVESRYADNLEAETIAEISFQLDDSKIARPTLNSPAIAAASPLWDEIQRDIDGVDRGKKPHDIGCDEFGNQTRPPLTKKDVGPSWIMN